jgi:hypothetical protein
LGTTNPFFIKSLEHWPNAIWLTPSLGFTASSVTSKTVQHSESSPVAAGTPKAVAGTTASQADRIRPKAPRCSGSFLVVCLARVQVIICVVLTGDSPDIIAVYCPPGAWSGIHCENLFGLSL